LSSPKDEKLNHLALMYVGSTVLGKLNLTLVWTSLVKD